MLKESADVGFRVGDQRGGEFGRAECERAVEEQVGHLRADFEGGTKVGIASEESRRKKGLFLDGLERKSNSSWRKVGDRRAFLCGLKDFQIGAWREEELLQLVELVGSLLFEALDRAVS